MYFYAKSLPLGNILVQSFELDYNIPDLMKKKKNETEQREKEREKERQLCKCRNFYGNIICGTRTGSSSDLRCRGIRDIEKMISAGLRSPAYQRGFNPNSMRGPMKR